MILTRRGRRARALLYLLGAAAAFAFGLWFPWIWISG